VHIIKTNAPTPTNFYTMRKTANCFSWIVLNTRKTNARRRTAGILKNRKWPCLKNGWTDRLEVWHSDDTDPPNRIGSLNFFSKNPRCQTAGRAGILKTVKS